MEIFKNKLFSKLFAAAFASQLGSTVGNMAFAFLFARSLQQSAVIRYHCGNDVFSTNFHK